MLGAPPDPDASLADRFRSVGERVAEACRRTGRDPSEITTIVVTKFHPAALVRELYQLGVRDVGENRHQEARVKAAELADLDDLRWHFVGQLQSNKVRQVEDYSRIIHSVDRPALVRSLDQSAVAVDCFLQVNLTADPGRGGARPDYLLPLAEQVLAAESLRLLGVMAVAPLGEPAAPAFERLRGLSEKVQGLAPEARAISAGMSGDFADAIAEGATHLRIGTAITGNRPIHG